MANNRTIEFLLLAKDGISAVAANARQALRGLTQSGDEDAGSSRDQAAAGRAAAESARAEGAAAQAAAAAAARKAASGRAAAAASRGQATAGTAAAGASNQEAAASRQASAGMAAFAAGARRAAAQASRKAAAQTLAAQAAAQEAAATRASAAANTAGARAFGQATAALTAKAAASRQAGAAATTAGAASASWLDATVRGGRAALSSVVNLRNAMVGFALVKTGQMILRPSIEMKGYELQLRRIVGGADAAKQVIGELAEEAETTPFRLNQLVEGYKFLRVFGGEALATRENLRLVGDAASITGSRDFASLAMWVGRAYAEIQRGGETLGEPLMRLMELGAIGAASRQEIESLAGNASAQFAALQAALGTYSGSMDELSQSTSGLVSTTEDGLAAAMRDFGDQVLPTVDEELRRLIEDLKDLRESGELETWGREATDVLRDVLSMARDLGAFVRDNRALLATLGMTAAGVFVINRLAGAARGVRAALLSVREASRAAEAANVTYGASAKTSAAAATLQGRAIGGVAAAANVAKLALRNLHAVAMTAFVGWQVGQAIGKTEAVSDAIDFVVNRLNGVSRNVFGEIDFGAADMDAKMRETLEKQREARRKAEAEAGKGFDQEAQWAAAREAAAAEPVKFTEVPIEFPDEEAEAKRAATAGTLQARIEAELKRRQAAEKQRQEGVRKLQELKRRFDREQVDKMIAARIADAERLVRAEKQGADKQQQQLQKLRDAAARARENLAKDRPTLRRERREREREQREKERQDKANRRALVGALRARAAGIPLTERGKQIIADHEAIQRAKQAEAAIKAQDGKVEAAKANLERLQAAAEKVRQQRQLQDLRDQIAAARKQAAAQPQRDAGLPKSIAQLRAVLEEVRVINNKEVVETAAANAMLRKIRDNLQHRLWGN